VRQTAERHGQPCSTQHMKDKDPAEGIVETVNDTGCDLIVMGSYGRRGLSKLLLGSCAAKVVALSSVPVLVCR
jgi:nucleotide-binding universal stress UspA family protein